MERIPLSESQRQDLIRRMKQETMPSRRLRMHIVMLAADGHTPTEIADVLYCSRTTVYTIVRRFREEGEAAFDDREKRGPPPRLTASDRDRMEALVEEAQPWSYGWLRSRWTCWLLAVQLLCERGVAVSRETIRRTLHRLAFVWRRPRPVPPPPDPNQKRRRLEAILHLLRELASSEGVFFQDESKLELNPRVGFMWMRWGQQRELPTPAGNRKVWISGALN